MMSSLIGPCVAVDYIIQGGLALGICLMQLFFFLEVVGSSVALLSPSGCLRNETYQRPFCGQLISLGIHFDTLCYRPERWLQADVGKA